MERFQNTGQPDWDWWARLWPAPGETLRRLGVAPGTAVAEVGSGNGFFALPAARIADPAPVYAVDVDESLLDELDGLAERHEIDNVTPIRGDARSLSDHLPERVDVVVLANAFHGIDDRASVVREASDSVRPGGRFAVVNWRDLPREETAVAGEARGPPTDLRIGPDETEAAVTDAADFAAVERVDLPPYHYAVVFER